MEEGFTEDEPARRPLRLAGHQKYPPPPPPLLRTQMRRGIVYAVRIDLNVDSNVEGLPMPPRVGEVIKGADPGGRFLTMDLQTFHI